MPAAAPPANELARLSALLDLAILDTGPEASFDAIVKSVTAITGAPIALISLVDGARQWFKASVGLEASETPRDVAFCAHALHGVSALIVPDSEVDPRFSDNPLVWNAPFVKSYLGAPLMDADGHVYGTLCSIDQKPHSWTELEIARIETLAGLVSELLKQRRAVLQADAQAREVLALSRALEEDRAQLEEISQVANVGGWTLDLVSQTLKWSAQTRKIHEVPDDFEPQLESAIEFYAPEVRDVVRAAVESSMATGEGWSLELPLITAKGRSIWVRTVGKAVLQDGVPIRAFGAFQDITAERAQHLELTAALARADRALADFSAYQTALDKHAIVAMTDARGEIIYVNDRFCEISGYDRESLIGQSHRLVNSGCHPKAFFEEMWRTISSGLPWHGEICNRAKDGSLYWVDTTVVPMMGANGRPERYVALRYDITARKKADAILNAALKRAEAATAAKSAFLANVSHEIRTPLNGVVGLAGALSKTSLDPKQQEMVSLIETSGQTLDRLLSDILDVSKVEAGKLDLHIEAFDLQNAVDTAAQLMRVRADDKGVSFDVTYGPMARGLFEGDVVRIRQIVSNLASNAVKFTLKGGVKVFVDVEDYDDAPSEITITIEDSGIGFDDEASRRLFSRFEQADESISRTFGGTGLGLSICRTLTEMMGGTIGATSTPGAGSRFTVKLPLERTMPLADFDRRKKPQDECDSVRLHGLGTFGDVRILLAEDHPINQRVISLILEPFGVDLTIVQNGREAVEMMSVSTFDLILMDMQMPEMDGLTATRAIRMAEKMLNRPRTPIAMLSANNSSEHIDRSLQAGCDIHIAKPVSANGLIDGLQMGLVLGADIKDANGVAHNVA